MIESCDSNFKSSSSNINAHQEVKNGLIIEENSRNNSKCSVCLQEIDESIYRRVIFQNKEKNLTVKSFHFFFPCWDLEYIFQKYLDFKIVNLGFSCEKTILKNYQQVRNMQRNLSLWV